MVQNHVYQSLLPPTKKQKSNFAKIAYCIFNITFWENLRFHAPHMKKRPPKNWKKLFFARQIWKNELENVAAAVEFRKSICLQPKKKRPRASRISTQFDLRQFCLLFLQHNFFRKFVFSLARYEKTARKKLKKNAFPSPDMEKCSAKKTENGNPPKLHISAAASTSRKKLVSPDLPIVSLTLFFEKMSSLDVYINDQTHSSHVALGSSQL